MSALFYSDEAARRIAKYLEVKGEMEVTGATHRLLEEARSYAVEALNQIMFDNEETTGYAAYRASLPRRKGVAA